MTDKLKDVSIDAGKLVLSPTRTYAPIIIKMLEKYREGFDMVVAVRESRDSDSWLKRNSARWFYSLLGRLSEVDIPSNAGDFRLMDRRVVEAIKTLPERTRFMKGLFAWLGFHTAVIQYDRPQRSHGKSKWNYWKLWNFALDGIVSFSTAPLRAWTYVGVVFAIISLLYLAVTIIKTFILGIDVPGYASLLSTVLFLGSLNLIGLGILGEYIGRIFVESKQRPLYIVDNVLGRGSEERSSAP